MNKPSEIILTTLYGSKVKYMGLGALPGMIQVETDDGYKTSILLGDLRENDALKEALKEHQDKF